MDNWANQSQGYQDGGRSSYVVRVRASIPVGQRLDNNLSCVIISSVKRVAITCFFNHIELTSNKTNLPYNSRLGYHNEPVESMMQGFVLFFCGGGSTPAFVALLGWNQFRSQILPTIDIFLALATQSSNLFSQRALR